jgi:hypothetical protein
MWCDYRLGAVMAAPEGAPQLELGQEPPPQVEVVETCDVAACFPCARRFGWRQISGVIVCVRGRRGRGCHAQSIDHCHLHAAAESRGRDAWIGVAGVELLRREARSACIVAFGKEAR